MDEMSEVFIAESEGRQEGEKRPQYIASLAATMGIMGAGAMLSWTSPALMELKNTNSSTAPFSVSEEEGSWVGSLLAVGALFSAIPAGFVADRVGRKMTLCGLSVPLALSWILVLAASGSGLLYVARLLAGAAIGGLYAIVPMYVGEIAESSVRGTLGTFFQIMFTVGVLYTYCVGASASYYGLAGACLVLPVAFFAAIIMMPETPTYLLMRNRKTDAQRALLRLRGSNYNYRSELVQLQADVDKASRNKGKASDLFKSPATRKALVIVLGLMFFQPLSGINAIIFYSEDIFQAAGSSLSPSVASIVVAVVQVVFSCASSQLMDRAGRRVLLLLSGSVITLCLAGLALYFQLGAQNAGWLPLLFVATYIGAFSLGFGPIPWILMGELFPTEVRSAASGFAVSLSWIFVFVGTKTFLPMVSAITPAGAYWVFFGICLTGTVFVFTLLPETKGKSLEEIQDTLAGGRQEKHDSTRSEVFDDRRKESC